jgi:hypothetical protein
MVHYHRNNVDTATDTSRSILTEAATYTLLRGGNR